MTLSFGLDSFGDVTALPDGSPAPMDVVLRNVVEQGALADSVGVDHFNLGEHHRPDFAISAPEIVLAALASRTHNITLGTAVTVLSTNDPVRVFQQFTTLDALAPGRAELVLGRGSFTESYPLFGFALEDYEALFEEKLTLFVKLLREESVSWSGKMRSPLSAARVVPPVGPKGLRVWIGVGGSPESVVRAVRSDLPMMLAIIGGAPSRFRPFVDLYHRACAEMGRAAQPLGVHSPGHIAATDALAAAELWPHHRALYDRIGRERGWPPVTEAQFRAEIESGSLYVGSPETVARKISETVRGLGLGRFSLKYASGALPHDALMRSIDLYGTAVIPRVRALLGSAGAHR